MRKELHYFDIYPKVVRTGVSSIITIKCKERYFIPPDGVIKIVITPMTEFVKAILEPVEIEATAQNGTIKFSYLFEKEQEYRLKVMLKEDEWVGLAVYALEQDLYELIPLKGDTHVHTNISDGWESPEATAGYYRKAGFDFIVISDHRQYKGAGMTREFFEDAKIDILIIDGEEVHAPKNPVHIVNFGGEACISDLYRNDATRYESEVQEISNSLEPSLTFSSEAEKYIYASCVWVHERIKEVGGMSVLAHSHALVNAADAYNVPDSLLELLFKGKCLDALELTGGRSPVELNMQLAFYYTACKRGYGDFPVLGGSDAHNVVKSSFSNSVLKRKGVTDRPYGFNEFYTIVFAKGNETKEIISAIKQGYSVAIDNYEGGVVRVHGDYRLVSYALFLLSEYFPLHDDMCYEEGRLMLEMAHGEESAAIDLSEKAGQINKLVRKYLQ